MTLIVLQISKFVSVSMDSILNFYQYKIINLAKFYILGINCKYKIAFYGALRSGAMHSEQTQSIRPVLHSL